MMKTIATARLALWAMGVAGAILVLAACTSSEAEDQPQATNTPAATPAVTAPQDTPSPTATQAPRRTPNSSNSAPALVAAITKVRIQEGSLVLEEGDEYDAEEIYFDTKNAGEETHHLGAVKWNGDPGSIPVDSDGNIITDSSFVIDARVDHVEQDAHILDLGELGPSNTAIWEIDPIQPGNYVVFCVIPGHYSDGEYFGFTIYEPPPEATPGGSLLD